MDITKIIETLNALIETCQDGKEGFRLAAEGVSRTEWKTFFHENALQRAKFSGELEQLVRNLGGEPETLGSIPATLHRSWINLRTYLEQNNEKAVLEECERGENMAVSNYKNALTKHLPQHIHAIVFAQYKTIQDTHNKVCDLCNLINDPAQAITPNSVLVW